jgi:hypothetical protein
MELSRGKFLFLTFGILGAENSRTLAETFPPADSPSFVWGPTSNQFAASLTFPKRTFNPTEAIPATLGLKSTRSAPVEVRRMSPYSDFDWTVLDQTRHQAPFTNIPSLFDTNRDVIVLEPGNAWSDTLDLRKRFVFNPGSYSISVVRSIQLIADVVRLGTDAPPIANPASVPVTIEVT